MQFTLTEIDEGLEENADFEEVASTAKALAFITWMNRWLIRRPDSASNQSSSMSMNKPAMLDLLKRARAYVAANGSAADGSTRVRYFSVQDGFR